MINLQQYIDSKKQSKADKKADKAAKIEFFKDSTSIALWDRIQSEEPEFANIIRHKGLDTIRANRYHEEVSELSYFMVFVHKASIILGFDLTECSFFTEYDAEEGSEDEYDNYIQIPEWLDRILDSNYGYHKQSEPNRLVADFNDVCDHEYREYDGDNFTGNIVYNKELGTGMIFFRLEDDVNYDQVNFVKTK